MIASKTTRKTFQLRQYMQEKNIKTNLDHILIQFTRHRLLCLIMLQRVLVLFQEKKGASHIYSRLGNPTVERLEQYITNSNL